MNRNYLDSQIVTERVLHLATIAFSALLLCASLVPYIS